MRISDWSSDVCSSDLQPGELLGAGLAHQDLDAGLVDVVAAAELVVHAQDRLEIGQQVLLGQAVADLHRQDRGAALAAAPPPLNADPAAILPLPPPAQFVRRPPRPAFAGTRAGWLDLATAGRESQT